MAKKRHKRGGPRQNGAQHDLPLMTTVDDEQYDELCDLAGQRVAHVALWEDSLADALAESESDPAAQVTFDLDLYLEEGVYFELYGVQLYPDPDAEPLQGLDATQHRLLSLVDQGLWLDEVAVGEEDELVLVLGHAQEPVLYLAAGAWLLEEWEELPGD